VRIGTGVRWNRPVAIFGSSVVSATVGALGEDDAGHGQVDRVDQASQRILGISINPQTPNHRQSNRSKLFKAKNWM